MPQANTLLEVVVILFVSISSSSSSTTTTTTPPCAEGILADHFHAMITFYWSQDESV